MKFAIITDTHLKPDTIGLNHSIYDQVLGYCVDNGIKRVLHGGDVFTSRAAQPLPVLMAFSDILRKFEASGVGLTVIPGNHDKVDLNDTNSYLDVFSDNKSLDVCRDFGCIHQDMKFVVCGMPYFKEIDEYHKRLDVNKFNAYKFAGKKVLLTHVDVEHPSIDKSIFNPFDLVLVGHFHDHNVINERVQYIGSTHQSNFGEDVNKGFVVLHDDLTIERVQLQFPRYVTYAVMAGETVIDEDFLRENIDGGNNVRVVLVGDKDKVDSIDTSALGGIGVKVQKLSDEAYRNVSVSEKVEVLDITNVIPKYEKFCVKECVSKDLGIELLKRI